MKLPDGLSPATQIINNKLDRIIQAQEAERSDVHAATKLDSSVAAPVEGLPVAGYKKVQPPHLVALVNENKVLEEKILRQIDLHVQRGAELDQRSVQMARGLIEDAFMRLNRGVFQPQRLEGDLE